MIRDPEPPQVEIVDARRTGSLAAPDFDPKEEDSELEIQRTEYVNTVREASETSYQRFKNLTEGEIAEIRSVDPKLLIPPLTNGALEKRIKSMIPVFQEENRFHRYKLQIWAWTKNLNKGILT